MLLWRTPVSKKHLVISTPHSIKRVLQYLWAKYESLSEQYYAANLNYAITYKTTINFSKAKPYSEQSQVMLSKVCDHLWIKISIKLKNYVFCKNFKRTHIKILHLNVKLNFKNKDKHEYLSKHKTWKIYTGWLFQAPMYFFNYFK